MTFFTLSRIFPCSFLHYRKTNVHNSTHGFPQHLPFLSPPYDRVGSVESEICIGLPTASSSACTNALDSFSEQLAVLSSAVILTATGFSLDLIHCCSLKLWGPFLRSTYFNYSPFKIHSALRGKWRNGNLVTFFYSLKLLGNCYPDRDSRPLTSELPEPAGLPLRTQGHRRLRTVVKNSDSEVKGCGFLSWICHFSFCLNWIVHSFLISDTGVIKINHRTYS